VLHSAVPKGNLDVVKWLIEKVKADGSATDKDSCFF
jgi:hypothetical protein